MKKVLATLLVIVMAVSLLAACGDSTPTTTGQGTGLQQTEAAAGFGGFDEAAGRDTTGDIGFYDPDYDYFANPTYKFIYLRVRNSPLYDDFARSFQAWGQKANVQVDVADVNGDNDLFISMIETLASQGYDGIFTDPDSTTYPAVVDKLREVGIPFMPGMGLPKGEDGMLRNPFVGFDYYQVGEKMGEWLVAYAKEHWADVDPSTIGVLGVDFSVVPEISVRIDGALKHIEAAYPGITGPNHVDRLTSSGRYFHADTIVGNLDATTAYQVSGAVFATNPQIERWLIVGTVDDFASGAVTAARDAGLEGQTVAISMGSPGLVAQWDAGEQNDFKASFTSIGVIYAEPIFFGLYAMVRGYATAENLWVPEWVNVPRGETYAQLLLPTIILEHHNYMYYFDWVNNYIGLPLTNYPATSTPDMFSTRVNPPPSYRG